MKLISKERRKSFYPTTSTQNRKHQCKQFEESSLQMTNDFFDKIQMHQNIECPSSQKSMLIQLSSYKVLKTATKIKSIAARYLNLRMFNTNSMKRKSHQVKAAKSTCLQWIYRLNLYICRKQLAFFRKNLCLSFCNGIYKLYVPCYLLINTGGATVFTNG